MTSRRRMLGLVAIVALWVLTTEPWGIDVQQLLVFMAPGALLGLAASWTAHALSRGRWTWQRGRDAVVLGALVLPPVIAFAVAIDGSARPQRLLASFVRAAWIAFAAGWAVAVAGWISRSWRVRRTRARRQVRADPPSASIPVPPLAPTADVSRTPPA